MEKSSTEWQLPGRVCSPRAGMDRQTVPAGLNSIRMFPARGDGPAQACRAQGRVTYVPRARGWTVARVAGKPVLHVCSPRAGMDRPAGRRTFRRRCMFPARGDGPPITRLHTNSRPYVPCARGWTSPAVVRPGAVAVCSPRAGMDRTPPHQRAASGRVFPARGDGPLANMAANTIKGYGPRARGWTERECRNGFLRTVCSPHAGMDRCRLPPCARWCGMFPARGDGPVA